VTDLLRTGLASNRAAMAALERFTLGPAQVADLMEAARRAALAGAAAKSELEALRSEWDRLAAQLGKEDARVGRIAAAMAAREAELAEAALATRAIARVQGFDPQGAALFLALVRDTADKPVQGTTVVLLQQTTAAPGGPVARGVSDEDGAVALLLRQQDQKALFDSKANLAVSVTDPQGKPAGSSKGPFQLQPGLVVQVVLTPPPS
jgi:hypothetical protein